MPHLLRLSDWSAGEILGVVDLALDVKRRATAYRRALSGQTLIMLFEKPSLRTRVSFETGMVQLGGHAIHYDLGGSPLGAGKETVADTARVLSRYVDAIMARLYAQSVIEELARHSTVPVINGLTDDVHPTQILADLLTLREKKGRLEGLSMAYLGDSRNNVTHSLLAGCARVGVSLRIGCPPDPAYAPDPAVVAEARQVAERSGAAIAVTHDAAEAVAGVDAVYTDSWMSYHVDPAETEARIRILHPYQVDAALMARAHPDAIFLNCLPALRGQEQTAEVLDGPQSVVFDQAENRLHMHKAILVRLLGETAGPDGDG